LKDRREVKKEGTKGKWEGAKKKCFWEEEEDEKMSSFKKKGNK